jgi:hypothetical protein
VSARSGGLVRGRFLLISATRIARPSRNQLWQQAVDVAASTEDFHRSLLTNHILPTWGDTALDDVFGIAVAGWAKHCEHLAHAEQPQSQLVDHDPASFSHLISVDISTDVTHSSDGSERLGPARHCL